MLDRLFRLSENNTRPRTELLAGLTTFLTMAYIIFVQPAVLSGRMFGAETGMDFGALTVTVCLASAAASLMMGLYARYPIALAPGMGCNFFFALTVVPAAAAAGSAIPWQTALAVVFLSGVLFVAVTLCGVRQMIIDAISGSMKNAIAVGIGLFIAFIGLQNTGLVVANPATLVALSPRLYSPDLLVFFAGLLATVGLSGRRVRGAIFWGILVATLAAVALKLAQAAPALAGADWIRNSMLATRFQLADRLVSHPPSIAPVFLKLDLAGALTVTMLPYIIIFFFMHVFDTLGTLIGVAEQAGFMVNGRLPRANRAFLTDALATMGGAALGHSSVTSYIESAAGVEAGGRTGLTAVVTAGLFLLAIFFTPLIAMVGSYPPITAPALVMVGAMMLRNVTRLAWDDVSELLPAFLIILGIPLSYSISDGIALGFIVYPFSKLLAGRAREIPWLTWLLSLLLLAYFIFLRS